MEKRLLIAVGLSVVILITWQFLFPTAPPPPPEPEPVASEPQAVETPGVAEYDRELPDEDPATPDAVPPDRVEPVGAAVETDVVLENELYRVVLTNAGARVRSWQLRAQEYLGRDGEPLELVPCFDVPDPALPLELDLENERMAIDLNRALYQVEERYAPAEDGRREGRTVEFRYADGTGIEVRKSLTVRPGDYLADLEVEVTDRGRDVPVRVTWGPGFQAKGSDTGGMVGSYYSYTGQVLWNIAGQVSRTKADKVEDQTVGGNVIWAGMDDQYFAALILPNTPRGQIRTWPGAAAPCPGGVEAEDEIDDVETARIAVSIPPSGAQLFVGPKKYRLLESEGHELDKAVWFATNPILAAIAKALFLALLWIHDTLVPNYGVAIILATVGLRIVLFPLNQFSMVRMKRTQIEMQRLQPKLNAIKNKYKKKKDAESRAKMNQETMELYKREGVSPMGGVVGCLPLLAQFPILLGFYYMLTVAIELRGAPFFGWISDLSKPDPFWVIPLLMGATMFIQQKMQQGKVTDPMQRQQQKIMMIMPFFFTYLCIQMPSGMVLYWFVSNLLGIVQQWLVNRHTTRLEAATQKA